MTRGSAASMRPQLVMDATSGGKRRPTVASAASPAGGKTKPSTKASASSLSSSSSIKSESKKKRRMAREEQKKNADVDVDEEDDDDSGAVAAAPAAASSYRPRNVAAAASLKAAAAADREEAKKKSAQKKEKKRAAAEQLRRAMVAAAAAAVSSDADSSSSSEDESMHAVAIVSDSDNNNNDDDDDADADADSASAARLATSDKTRGKPAKKILGRSLRMRHVAHMRLARMFERARFDANGNEAHVLMPVREATSKKLVQHALFSVNDDTVVTIGADVAQSIFHAACDQTMHALVAARDNWLAQRNATRKASADALTDAELQSLVLSSIVRAGPLERALKQTWAATDPPGFDSSRAFDELQARVANDPVEMARIEASTRVRLAADERRENKAALATLEDADANSLTTAQRRQLSELRNAREHEARTKTRQAYERLKKSIITNTEMAEQLAASGIPTTHAKIVELRDVHIPACAETLATFTARVAALGVKIDTAKRHADTLSAEDDADELAALRTSYRADRHARALARKENDRTQVRMTSLRQRMAALTASVPKKDQRINDAHARNVANTTRIAEIEKLLATYDSADMDVDAE